MCYQYSCESEFSTKSLCLPGERGLGGAMQGPSAGTMSEVRGPAVGCGIGSGLKTELPHPQQQVVYVFTTGLANRWELFAHLTILWIFLNQSYLRANSEACHDFSELLSFVPQCCRGSSERTDRFHPHVSPAKCSSYQVESGQSNVQRFKFVQNLLDHRKSYRCMWK